MDAERLRLAVNRCNDPKNHIKGWTRASLADGHALILLEAAEALLRIMEIPEAYRKSDGLADSAYAVGFNACLAQIRKVGDCENT